MNTFTMSLLVLIPALLLCWYIYVKDRQEKEPLWLLAVLFGTGAVAYIPAVLAQNGSEQLLGQAFSPYITHTLTGAMLFTEEWAFAAHSAVSALTTALIFETLKWAVLFLLTFKSKHFGHLFDGLVYAVFVSLGFAVAESLWFAAFNNWDTLLLRSVVSVPAHMTYGVCMGFCYTLWRTYRIAATHEKQLADRQFLSVRKPLRCAPWLVMSLAGPVLLHTFQSFADTYHADAVSAMFYILLGVLYALAFVAIHRLSKADDKSIEIAHRILMHKYPSLSAPLEAPEKQ